ncbi:Cutinase domain containing protein [Pyrenophora tritici-repentis]|nr:Cutinase domain containing protein [Pyrenophora tritici-repentis]
MIARIAFSALLYASTAFAVCTKLEDCPQFEHLKTDECQTYHHFIARGSTSPYPGHVIETVGKVCNALNTQENPKACGYEDVQYAAQNGGERWCKSAHEGAINGAEQMRNYTARCPESHLLVMGFSQGGSVMLDVLGGGGGMLWGCDQAQNPAMDINSAPGSKSTLSSLATLEMLLMLYSCRSRRIRSYASLRKPNLHPRRWRHL